MKRRSCSLLLGGLVALLSPLGACSSSPSSNPSPDLATPSDLTAGPPDLAPAAPGCPAGSTLTTANNAAFIGHWVIQDIDGNNQTAMGQTAAASNTTWSLVEITADANNNLVMTKQDCRIVVAGGSALATVTVPDKVPQTTPPSSANIHVCSNGSWYRDPVTVLVGVKLANPNTDALPTSKTDPAVYDQDGDGNPAVTFNVMITGLGNQTLYNVQRQKYSFSSSALPVSSKASGVPTFTLEQVTVDASNALLKQPVSIVQDPATSSFKLVQQTPTQLTCAQLIAQGTTIFK